MNCNLELVLFTLRGVEARALVVEWETHVQLFSRMPMVTMTHNRAFRCIKLHGRSGDKLTNAPTQSKRTHNTNIFQQSCIRDL